MSSSLPPLPNEDPYSFPPDVDPYPYLTPLSAHAVDDPRDQVATSNPRSASIPPPSPPPHHAVDDPRDQLATSNPRSASLPPPRPPHPAGVPLGIDDAGVLTAAVVWVSGAVGAGVLGNAAYDLFKATVSRLLRRSAPKILSQPQAVQIARKALRERLMQAEIDGFPEDEELQVAQWSLSERGWWIILQGLDVRAYVTIPAARKRKNAIEAEVKVSLGKRALPPADLG